MVLKAMRHRLPSAPGGKGKELPVEVRHRDGAADGSSEMLETFRTKASLVILVAYGGI